MRAAGDGDGGHLGDRVDPCRGAARRTGFRGGDQRHLLRAARTQRAQALPGQGTQRLVAAQPLCAPLTQLGQRVRHGAGDRLDLGPALDPPGHDAAKQVALVERETRQLAGVVPGIARGIIGGRICQSGIKRTLRALPPIITTEFTAGYGDARSFLGVLCVFRGRVHS
jgi:hypothetical protein